LCERTAREGKTGKTHGVFVKNPQWQIGYGCYWSRRKDSFTATLEKGLVVWAGPKGPVVGCGEYGINLVGRSLKAEHFFTFYSVHEKE
jgi:hypothetical protein